ncbi:hypothetical protein [Candidatus Pelagisphaera phototrophica]|uniref:hypothetical protein n=1 Tax=Candidatus Pelagisphaera phototrophica TaxID=2684113 RepID=UPI0019E37E13|nr:hypothetical protein [Candidatus Pelagisphaera phototrophica]QXD32527.1 hypothetical protein GA004_02035 [Candidatus Pelagisphaera phototrophica]
MSGRKGKRYKEEEIIRILREAENCVSFRELLHKHRFSTEKCSYQKNQSTPDGGASKGKHSA